ncbi:TPA: hypothetical protein U2B98_000808 [Streptococcus suis]|nr:hypothetical protein [Streptococcus suis]NRG97360.1 hypothetical protein [Streptococcus suis]HEM6111874.1 hypothetical protein [Streptococcus suis]HEM6190623.1 hypothetical protein [Streptococcus suis]HEM6265931.1 hypothetical protein [Streptococcus suis]
MDLYDAVSKKLGKDLLQYLEDLRKSDAQKTDWTEDDIEENPLSVLTMEELELFEEYALLTYQMTR